MSIRSLKKVLLPGHLALVILLQSCQVYNKTSVSLEEASQTELRAKVISKDEEKLKYKRILSENQEYFGLKKKNGNWVKFPLEEQNIEELLLQDKKKSTWGNILLFIGIPLGMLLILYIIFLFTWTVV